jgi:tripartite-type tricarboxylate transporter receptor subunit TctC
MLFRSFVGRWLAIALGSAALIAPLAAQADAYPSRPIRLVVGFGPGGLGDTVARSVALKMSESMGQQVVVINQPGAGGITAATTVARAAPDGYTLLLVSGQNAFSPSLFKSLPYDPVNSFSMVSTLGRFHFLVVVDKDSPIRNLKDLADTARRDRDRFTLATIAVGSAQHLSARLLLTMGGLDVPIAPHKTTGDVVTALKGGTVQAGVETTTGAISHVKNGNLRAIATSSRKRLVVLPDIPTVAESGVAGLANYESDSWNGIVAPANTPRDVVQRLHAEIVKALSAADVRERFLSLGIEPATSTPEELKQVFINDAAKWGAVIRQANITPE